MSPKRHDWPMDFFHNSFSILYCIYFEGLSMKFISPSTKKIMINWIFFFQFLDGVTKKRGIDSIMAFLSRFYVDSPSFAKYFKGTTMRLQQVFVLN
jgi:hypothetical protein